MKQLLTAQQDQPDDPFKVDGQELAQVQIVGCIIEVQNASTNLKLQVEDGTGRIEVTMWTNSDDSEYETQRRQQWREGLYVKVIGSLRSFQDKRTITAFDIRLITDHNEVTHHYLESIWVHLKNTKSPNKPMGGGNFTSPGQPNFQSPGGQQMSSFGGAAITNAGGENGFTSIQQQVNDVLKQHGGTDTGLTVQEVQQQLGNSVSEQEIREALDFLAGEGHVYTTIDENHFKTTME